MLYNINVFDFLFGKNRKKVGLALGSGAGRGFAHIGVIKTLLRNGVPIDFISGSSIGAVIAAYYALTLDIDRLEKIKAIFRKRIRNYGK